MNMASGIYLNEKVWSSPLVGYYKKQNRRVMDLRRKKRGQPDHTVRSSVAISKLPLGREIVKRRKKKKKKNNNKKEKCDFLIICFVGIF